VRRIGGSRGPSLDGRRGAVRIRVSPSRAHTLNKTLRWSLPLLLVVLALVWWWQQPDHYDYAAAFEDLARRQPQIVSVPALAGADAERVAVLLGPPTQCERSAYGENCRYRTANADIAFIDGKADWITLSGFDDVKPGAEALALLGLEPAPADSQSDTEMRWQDTQGLREILLVHNASEIRYVRIKTSTP